MANKLSADDRKLFLAKLKEKLEAYIGKQKDRLKLEYEFLDLILSSHGVAAAGRRTANMDKLKGLAQVWELLPSFEAGKYRSETDELMVDGLPKAE